MVKRDFRLRGDTQPAGVLSRMKVTSWQGPALYSIGSPCHLGGPRHPPHQHTTMHKGMHRSLGAHESRARWQGVVGG